MLLASILGSCKLIPTLSKLVVTLPLHTLVSYYKNNVSHSVKTQHHCLCLQRYVSVIKDGDVPVLVCNEGFDQCCNLLGFPICI